MAQIIRNLQHSPDCPSFGYPNMLTPYLEEILRIDGALHTLWVELTSDAGVPLGTHNEFAQAIRSSVGVTVLPEEFRRQLSELIPRSELSAKLESLAHFADTGLEQEASQ